MAGKIQRISKDRFIKNDGSIDTLSLQRILNSVSDAIEQLISSSVSDLSQINIRIISGTENPKTLRIKNVPLGSIYFLYNDTTRTVSIRVRIAYYDDDTTDEWFDITSC